MSGQLDVFNVARIFTFFAATFVIAMAIAPVFIHFLYKYKIGKNIREGGDTPVFSALHLKKAGTPTMGGLLIWGTVVFIVLLVYILSWLFPSSIFTGLNFLSRSQTWLPIGVLIVSGAIGAIDDLMNVKKIGAIGGGMKMRHRLIIYAVVALIAVWWFYSKLEWNQIHIPFMGDFALGAWFIPFFTFIIVATSFSVNETDGLDGLAGGVLLFTFMSYGVLSYARGQMDLAVLCAAIAGALAAFLWFNIFPARFFMGDTGAMGLGTTLGVIAMLTNSVFLLPIIGFIFVLESLSVIIQITSKKLRGKKVFLSSPLHHHFEAKGWPETKVTMRFWLISAITASIGLVIGLIDKAI